MKKKLISWIMLLVICFSLALPVSADPSATDFVIDEWGVLESEEPDALANLNDYAYSLYESTGVAIYFVFTNAENLVTYDIDLILNGEENYVILLQGNEGWYTFYGGRGEVIDQETEEALYNAYNEAESYVEGVTQFLYETASYLESVQDASGDVANESEETEIWLVYDMGDLLTDEEEESLNKKLQSIRKKYKAEIVVHTVKGFEDDIEQYAEECYEGAELGYGDDCDGTLLVVSVEPNKYYIYSNGFTDEALDAEKIGEKMKSDLSDGNYKAAFDTFAEQCDYYLDGHINGFPFEFGKNLVICLIIGLVIGLIVAFVLKGQLKSVRKQDAAANYVKPGSMQLTHSGDYYMYRTVTRTEKQQNNSSSGSGSSRGSGGGTF